MQVPNWCRRVPFSAGHIQTAGGVETTAHRSPWHVSHAWGNEPPGDKGHSTDQALTSTGSFTSTEKLIKCNQFICGGGGAGGRSMCHRTLDVNRYTNVLRPIPFPTHCWPVLKHVPPRVKRQQGNMAGSMEDSPHPHPRTHTRPGTALKRGPASRGLCTDGAFALPTPSSTPLAASA